MLNQKYSHIEDLLMIAQAWRITDMKELENIKKYQTNMKTLSHYIEQTGISVFDPGVNLTYETKKRLFLQQKNSKSQA